MEDNVRIYILHHLTKASEFQQILSIQIITINIILEQCY